MPIATVARQARGAIKLDDPDAFFDLAGWDYGAIARQVADERKAGNKMAPKVTHLAQSITSVTLTDTMEGSSTLEIEVADPEFELIDFFDIDRNGKLDSIELNYPEDSPTWWRLTQLAISADSGQALSLTLTFMERPAVLLMHKRGPKKSKRGKVTRAEFLKDCVDDVKKHPLKFRCTELHVKQPIAGTKTPPR